MFSSLLQTFSPTVGSVLHSPQVHLNKCSLFLSVTKDVVNLLRCQFYIMNNRTVKLYEQFRACSVAQLVYCNDIQQSTHKAVRILPWCSLNNTDYGEGYSL